MSPPHDFLGVPYKIGDYVASGGAGNGRAEYGMILYRVVSLKPKLKLVRLAMSYPTHSAEETVVRQSGWVTVQNTNKYVIVQPPPAVTALFERAISHNIFSGRGQSHWTLGPGGFSSRCELSLTPGRTIMHEDL